MTFFLGVAAGISPEDARTIALASQYVDDNPATRPLEEDGGLWGKLLSVFNNQEKLRYYHFMADTLQVPVSQIHDVVPGNQLCNLHRAASLGPTPLAQMVFYGEFLHALADTYAHADQNNNPYKGVNLLGLGTGHGFSDSDPDFTFNHWGFPAVIDYTLPWVQPNEGVPLAIHWNVNEDRTFAAERQLYDQLKNTPWADPGKAVSFESIADWLREFNHTGETEQYRYIWDPETGKQTRTEHAEADHGDIETINKAFTEKLKTLNKALQALGFGDKDVTSKEWGYIENQGEKNRKNALGGLSCEDYPGVILPAGVCPMPANP